MSVTPPPSTRYMAARSTHRFVTSVQQRHKEVLTTTTITNLRIEHADLICDSNMRIIHADPERIHCGTNRPSSQHMRASIILTDEGHDRVRGTPSTKIRTRRSLNPFRSFNGKNMGIKHGDLICDSNVWIIHADPQRIHRGSTTEPTLTTTTIHTDK